MLMATVVVMALYLLLNAIFLYAPPLERLLGQDPVADIATVAAGSIGGPRLAMVVRVIIVLALVTSISANVQAGPRVYARMAADGVFPAMFDFQHGPPRAAILLQSALAIVVIRVSTLQGLLNYLGFTLSLSTAATVASLFVLKRRQPPGQRVASSWFLALPAMYIVAIVGLALVAASGDPHQLTGTAATVVSGMLAYWLVRQRLKGL
jgi:APA family basic amino acid/polyamine antiporter